MFLIDNNVSDIKSFETLWESKGLGNWDMQIEDEYQLECLKFWCKILYNIDGVKFEELIKNIRIDRVTTVEKFREEHPRGSIYMLSVVQILPNKIQTLFGNYIP